jgi:hypothetical protein
MYCGNDYKILKKFEFEKEEGEKVRKVGAWAARSHSCAHLA